jgi:hypothetical protein
MLVGKFACEFFTQRLAIAAVITAQSDARSRGGGKRVTFQIRSRI